MIHAVDPRQSRLFDPVDGVIPPTGWRIIAEGWQGVFRHVLLEVMPVARLGQHFSDSLGAPTKELCPMAGLVFLADFHGGTNQEAIEVYIFRSDVEYALNLEPGATVCTRTLDRYQKLFRAHDLAMRVFEDVTTRLIQTLDLDVSRQPLRPTPLLTSIARLPRPEHRGLGLQRLLAP